MSGDARDTEHPEPGGTEVTQREGVERPNRPPREGATATLSRGTLVGRYVVLDVLGTGGMGVVYTAFDPELDRKVAIKLLQAQSRSSTGSQAWLLREAQALARLSHPNVVAVHDVGTLLGDRVFVAMELVVGMTLRGWLRGEERPWREVVKVMLAAGAGLAAAHAAGLVHRDFKPDNVLVGSDGRVRVMDFGLARLRPESDADGPELLPESKSPLSERLTIAGSIVGTPAYMAPEIFAGEPADARSDQFAFGVALFEGLFRVRPYDSKDLRSAQAGLRPKSPPETGVPARIRRVVMRAIAIDPASRYPAMDALLADLAIDPTVRRRRIALAGVAACALAGAVGGTYAMRGSHTEQCAGAERRLAGVWDFVAKQRVHSAFLATKLGHAQRAFEAVVGALNKYAGAWTKASSESCEATRVLRDQTEEVMALRQACLDQRLIELDALVGVLAEANPALVDKADKSVFELDPIARCANVAALLEPGKPPPEQHDQAMQIERQLAGAKADLIAGRYVPALVGAKHAADRAHSLGWPPLEAEALGIRASALMLTANFEEGAAEFTNMAWVAIAGRRDDLVAAAAYTNAMVVASGLGKPGEAKVWLAFGEAFARRNGADPRTDLQHDQVTGVVLAESGDVLGAVAAHERAFRTAERVYGRDGPSLFADEATLAATLSKAFAFRRAVPHFEHAIALREHLVGPDHPDLATMLSNLSVSYRRLHAEPKAHAVAERALAIRERIYGKNSPVLAATLDNLSDVLVHEGNLPAALATIDRAKRLSEILPGKDHPVWHQIATDYAEILTLMGRYKEAIAVYDEVVALERKTSSAVLPRTQMSRAELALATRAWADAESLATASVAGFEAAGGPMNPELLRALTDLGRAKIGLGKRDEAKPLLERALAIAAKTELSDEDLAVTRDALASLASH